MEGGGQEALSELGSVDEGTLSHQASVDAAATAKELFTVAI